MSNIAANDCVVRYLGLQSYQPVLQAMQNFTNSRTTTTRDEIWLLEHHPVFTQGQAGKSEHLLSPGTIPVIQADRGGQITYHGPGQLVAYLLVDLRRLDLGVRALVTLIEASIVAMLARYNIAAQPKSEAPGVYVHNSSKGGEAKIAQLGLRVRRGCTFHGLSLNVAMDLQPFSQINPCGYQGLAVTDMHSETPQAIVFNDIAQNLLAELAQRLGYTGLIEMPSNLQDSYE